MKVHVFPSEILISRTVHSVRFSSLCFFGNFEKSEIVFLFILFVFRFLDFKSSFFPFWKFIFLIVFLLLFLDIILKTAWYATWYFKSWYFGTFLCSKLVLLPAFVFQKELFHKPETFEKQRQPRVPVLKIRKFQSTSFYNTRWHTKQLSKWCSKKGKNGKQWKKIRSKWKKMKKNKKKNTISWNQADEGTCNFSTFFFAIPPRELLLDREGWHNRPFAVHKGLDSCSMLQHCCVSSAPSPKRNLSQLPRSETCGRAWPSFPRSSKVQPATAENNPARTVLATVAAVLMLSSTPRP